jgi:hypothetical protein
MDRKQFLCAAGRAGLGAGLCGVAAGAPAALGQAPEVPAPTHPCDERVKFAEEWVTRWFAVLDEGVDEPTRAALMRANGRACARAFLASSGREAHPVPFDQWVARLRERGGREGITVDGRAVFMEFTSNYQGKPAPEGSCLCPLVETKPAGLSGTYCLCSVGYVEELFGRTFTEPVKVSLLESTLRGGKRCRFRIDVG